MLPPRFVSIHREEREAREAQFSRHPCGTGMTIARDHVHMDDHASPVAHAVIGSAIEVHRELGPGLLESAYCHCLAHELTRRGIPFLREYPLPVRYKDAVV